MVVKGAFIDIKLDIDTSVLLLSPQVNLLADESEISSYQLYRIKKCLTLP